MKKQIVLSVLAVIALLLAGCSNPVDSAINAMNAATAKIDKAAQAGDEDGFLDGLQAMANAMDKLKPAVEAIPGDKRPEYMAKAQDAAKAWQKVAVSPKFLEITEKIANSPKAQRLTEIMRQVQTTMQRDGGQF